MLSNHLKQEKKYPKQLPAPQVLEWNAFLASFAAYATASPPPGSYDIMLVPGSLARIDHAQKRYALGVDEWRQMTASLKDAKGGSGEYHARSEDLCVCAPLFVLLFFFFSCLIFVFFRVPRLIKPSNSKKSEAGNIRESLLLNHQRFPSSRSFYHPRFSCVVLAPP